MPQKLKISDIPLVDRPREKLKEKSFGIIPILKKDNKYLFLLIHHRSGHWAFPKGHSKTGETETKTAKREFKEETGVKEYSLIDNISFIENYTFVHNNKSVEKTVKYFIAIVKSPNVHILKKEIQDYKWVNHEKAIKLITFDSSKKIITEVIEYFKKEY